VSRRVVWIVVAAVAVVLLIVLLRPRGVGTSTEAGGPASDTPSRTATRSTSLGDTSDAPAQRRARFLPDAAMTPGAALDVSVADVCAPGYSKRVRNVPQAVKHEVYAEYGVRSHHPDEYEIDHLISLELGGSNARRNLWPQSFVTHPWNAHVKDELENELHRAICAHEISMGAAQREIAGDWIAAWRARFHRQWPARGE